MTEKPCIEKLLRLHVRLHSVVTSKKFFSYIKKEFSEYNIYPIKKHGESSSGCFFAKLEGENQSYFLKGNEDYIFNCIKNEIRIQNRIKNSPLTQYCLCMVKSNINKKWILYPYMECRTLKQILKERQLEASELELLGKFLVSILDELYALNIIHRDLRPDNIMIKESIEGKCISFILFDFGCSIMDGIDIWKKDSFWNDYLKSVVGNKYRYKNRTDDAGNAFAIYLAAGGKKTDEMAQEIRNRIGRLSYER